MLSHLRIGFLLFQFLELVHIKGLIPAHINKDLDTAIKFQK